MNGTKNKFDFSSFAYNPNGSTDPTINSNLPPRIERKAIQIDSTEEENSNDSEILKTRSGRRIQQTKNNLPKISSSDEEDIDDDDEDVEEFKSKASKPQRKARATKDKKDDHDIVNGFKSMKKSKQLSNYDDRYDVSAFKPLRKTNTSITISKDHDDSLSKPLKQIRLNEVVNSKNSMPDEIHAILEEDDSGDSINFKKKRQQRCNC